MVSRNPAFKGSIAYIIQLPGYMGLLTSIVAIIFEEYLALIPFLGIAVITLIPGWIAIRKSNIQKRETKIANPFIFAAYSYGLVSVIGALPLWGTAVLFNSYGIAPPELMNLHSLLNALFESFAGITSSGLTMINNPEKIPHVVQFWRSLSQWLGGFGVIILAAYIFTPKIEGMKSLIQAEVGHIGFSGDVIKTVRSIGIIYFAFTILALLLYLIVNQPLWISLNHALTSVSTGGFNVTNESFEFQPLNSKIVSLFLLTLGAMGFGFHRELIVRKHLKGLFKHKENLWFLIILFAGVILLSAESWLSTTAPDITDNVYQWISAFTTSGYQTTNLRTWEDGRLFLLSLAMFIGGVGGSTAGGLKVRRLLLLVNAILYNLSGKNSQKYKEGIKYYGEDDDINAILLNFTTLFGLWLLLIAFSVGIISFIVSGEYTIAAVIFEVISAQSNVGLSTGLTGAGAHWLIKFDFIILMWMGRLELIAVVLLFKNWFKKGTT